MSAAPLESVSAPDLESLLAEEMDITPLVVPSPLIIAKRPPEEAVPSEEPA
jgi:hypothetical protein